VKNKQENKFKINEEARFLLEMSTLNQNVTVWQLYIMFLRVMDLRHLREIFPGKIYSVFAKKAKW
jgi:hypothetical protein